MIDFKKVSAELNDTGLCVIKGFLQGEALSKSIDEFDKVFSETPDFSFLQRTSANQLQINGENESGRHMRLYPQAYSHFQHTLDLFYNQNFYNLCEKYFNAPVNFMMQTFMEHTVKMPTKMHRQGVLHFDPYWSLKFGLYLTDATVENGAFHYVPKSRSVGKHYRENKLDIDDLSGMNDGYRHRLEDYTDKPEFTIEDAVPIEGSAGDLIIFDTDVLHYGAVLKGENIERKIALIHNRPR